MTIDALRREINMAESLTDARFEAIENLIVERIGRIDAMMEYVEKLRVEHKQDTRSAVDAALEAQKETSAKMEKAISDQLVSLRGAFEATIRSIESSIADLKDRMTVLESIKQGQAEQRTERREMSAGVVAAFGVGASLILAVLAVGSFIAIGT